MELQVTTTFKEVAEIELMYRTKVKPSLRPSVTTSRQAYEILRSHWDMDTIELQETFKILLLSTSNKVIGMYQSSTGGSTQCLVDIRLVFACALKANTKAIILSHNHPSGNLKASEADLAFTKRMIEAGKLLEIPVVDHLIITTEGYLSFADEGLL